MISNGKEPAEMIKKGVNLPEHIAIIMDGNGRWAKKRGLPRVAGHRQGIKTVRRIVEVCGNLDISVLTLYTFSTENWKRPKKEVSALMKLLVTSLEGEIDDLMKNNVRLMTIGDMTRLPDKTRKSMVEGVKRTSGNSGLTLNLALNYGAREEIVRAVRSIAAECKEGSLNINDITAERFSDKLFTKELPDPDLLIRTSGEMRISNFLLWQIAYAELYISDVFWPDFGRQDLYRAIASFQKRERRFGKVSEQLNGDL